MDRIEGARLALAQGVGRSNRPAPTKPPAESGCGIAAGPSTGGICSDSEPAIYSHSGPHANAPPRCVAQRRHASVPADVACDAIGVRENAFSVRAAP